MNNEQLKEEVRSQKNVIASEARQSEVRGSNQPSTINHQQSTINSQKPKISLFPWD